MCKLAYKLASINRYASTCMCKIGKVQLPSATSARARRRNPNKDGPIRLVRAAARPVTPSVNYESERRAWPFGLLPAR